MYGVWRTPAPVKRRKLSPDSDTCNRQISTPSVSMYSYYGAAVAGAPLGRMPQNAPVD